MSPTQNQPQDTKKVVHNRIPNPSPNPIKTFKIIVVGDSNVGKTSLTYRFCDGKFIERTEATIGVGIKERTLNIDGEDLKLQLWDTAGQERFRKSMVHQFFRNAHAVVLVYDVTNRASFDSLVYWLDECERNCITHVPRILVGNKCDEKIEIKTNLAQKFADQHGMLLFETSARLDSRCDSVEAMFLTLAQKLKNQKQPIPFDEGRLLQARPSSNDNSWSWSCC